WDASTCTRSWVQLRHANMRVSEAEIRNSHGIGQLTTFSVKMPPFVGSCLTSLFPKKLYDKCSSTEVVRRCSGRPMDVLYPIPKHFADSGDFLGKRLRTSIV